MRRSPEEIWQRLVDESGEDAIERAASVSVAQAEKELRLAGFDVPKERAKATALLEELSSPTGSGAHPIHGEPDAGEPAGWVSVPPPAKSPRSTLRWTMLLAAALAAAATGGGVLYALAHRHPPQDKPVEVPQPTPGPTVAPPTPVAPTAPTLERPGDDKPRRP